ncbi:hypothetical protein APTSU1_000503000 [Apodemus speciosus]|uniref:Uncharacterized protein n=1 Tax=Apodemus speciosus TaxID=105296 RepID=A0ABQ0ES80_APOSI
MRSMVIKDIRDRRYVPTGNPEDPDDDLLQPELSIGYPSHIGY